MGDVEVNDVAIKTLGTTTSGLGDDLDTQIGNLNAINIEPGDFEDAKALTTTVNERRDLVVDNFEQAKLVFTGIGEGLESCAAVYQKTNADNDVEVSALDGMVTSTAKNLPGFKDYEPPDD